VRAPILSTLAQTLSCGDAKISVEGKTELMSTHHLHLRAYVCKKCNGPVVATTLSVRKTPISGETTTGQLVPSCLLCGDRPVSVDEPGFGFAPIAWPLLSALPADPGLTLLNGVTSPLGV
jgi:hypothetical protein